MTTPAIVYRCGLPVAMTMLAAGGAAVLAGSLALVFVGSREIVGLVRAHGLRVR